MRRSLVVGALFACTAALAGCGSGSGADDVARDVEDFGTTGAEVPLDRYARTFCDAMGDVIDIPLELGSMVDATRERADERGTDFVNVLQEYDNGLLRMSRAADGAKRRLSEVGYPRMAQGEAVAARVRQLLAFGPDILAVKRKIDGFDRTSPKTLVYRAEQELLPFIQDLTERVQVLTSIYRRPDFVASLPERCHYDPALTPDH